MAPLDSKTYETLCALNEDEMEDAILRSHLDAPSYMGVDIQSDPYIQAQLKKLDERAAARDKIRDAIGEQT